VSRVIRAGVVLLAAGVVALGGATGVRAWHDPYTECFGQTQTIVGTATNDVLTGTPGDDVIKAGAGDDIIDGGEGDDIICGEVGNDTILGGAGSDSLSGDDGDDKLDAGEDPNGEDFDVAFFYWAPGAVSASLVTNTATGWGTDTLAGFEGLVGSNFGGDTLTGDDQVNLLDGRAGNDTLLAGGGDDGMDGDAGNDLLDGGPGIDLAFYDYSPRAVVASLATRRTTGWGTDTLRSVEDLHGSQKGDVLVGNGGNNALTGHCGPDRIQGGGGNDVITGDECPVNAGLSGKDRMYGGPGRDRLNGGPKKDWADGGSGRDVCRAETKKRCP
jgi:Ca2+-binding RTX toxin-like protein